MSQSQLDVSEISHFRRDGFVVARGLADPDMCDKLKAIAQDHVSREVSPLEYEADLGYPGAPASRSAAGGRTVRRLLQACARDPLFRQWATSDALHARVAQLLGQHVMLVQAHHNCVMTKHPQYGSLTGWHQDIRYWSFERPDLISVWLALGEERQGNGGLWTVPGSHMLMFDRARFDDALFFREDEGSNRALLDQRVPVELNRGDVLFFHCRLLHAAGRNESNETKFSVVFTYCAMDNRPLAGTRSASLPLIELH